MGIGRKTERLRIVYPTAYRPAIDDFPITSPCALRTSIPSVISFARVNATLALPAAMTANVEMSQGGLMRLENLDKPKASPHDVKVANAYALTTCEVSLSALERCEKLNTALYDWFIHCKAKTDAVLVIVSIPNVMGKLAGMNADILAIGWMISPVAGLMAESTTRWARQSALFSSGDRICLGDSWNSSRIVLASIISLPDKKSNRGSIIDAKCLSRPEYVD